MSKLENEVKHVVDEALEQVEVPSNFEKLWGEYNMKNKKVNKKRYRIALVAAVIMAMSATVMGAKVLIKRTDNIKYTFESDSKVLGSWSVVDYVKEIKDFKVNRPAENPEDLYLVQLTFKEDGKINSVFREEGKLYAPQGRWHWTKGMVINPQDKTASSYKVQEIDGEEYMFMQWKSGDYIYGRLEEPYYYVFKKADEMSIEKQQPKHDEINIPFEENEQMLGKWQSVGFVKSINDFDASIIENDLYLEEMNILEEGRLNLKIEGQVYSLWSWSDSKVIDPIDHVVNACTIKEINGKTYMFMEWKTGDYTELGIVPQYYVFEKKNS